MCLEFCDTREIIAYFLSSLYKTGQLVFQSGIAIDCRFVTNEISDDSVSNNALGSTSCLPHVSHACKIDTWNIQAHCL